jgi:hypothetical protein
MFIVLWAVAIGALVLSSVQLFGFRQSMLGRQALGRVQARWAARGGIEYTIAIMADHTTQPVVGDAFAMVRDFDQVRQGTLDAGGAARATWDIRHNADGRDWWGPMDEHSKLNLNSASADPGLLQRFRDLPPDVADAILDWTDSDDEERALGAERHYYLGFSMPYEPRNYPMRSIAELELVAGIWPEHLRGEDWNMNNRLDPNEDDGDLSFPPDNADGRLDAGWSGLMTTLSVTGGMSASGQERINLLTAQTEAIQERLGVDGDQAGALVAFANQPNARLETLLITYMDQQAQAEREASARSQPPAPQSAQPTRRSGNQAQSGPVLTEEQLRAVFDEASIGDPKRRAAGKLNINTVSEELLLELFSDNQHLADEILYLRGSRLEGITSLVDLIGIPAFADDPAALQLAATLMDTRSNVYSICSRGRSDITGAEVEIFVVVDRSTVPLRILEYRE